jgi:hypothetical protein
MPESTIKTEQQIQPVEPIRESDGLDLEELARKVVELLMRELRLENDRTGKY